MIEVLQTWTRYEQLYYIHINVHFPRVEGALLKSGLMKGLWVNKFGIKGFITFTLKYGLVETQKWKIKALENWCG